MFGEDISISTGGEVDGTTTRDFTLGVLGLSGLGVLGPRLGLGVRGPLLDVHLGPLLDEERELCGEGALMILPR